MNFKIKIVTGRMPWPFSWGPFKRRRAFILRSDEFGIQVWQRTAAESGSFTHAPVELECHSGALEVTTTCDFKSGSRLKRRTKI
jgi:hypothetical protein